MRRTIVSLASALSLPALAACASVWPTKSVATTSAPVTALSCAADAGKELHYKVTYLDTVRLKLTMRRTSKAPIGPEVDAMEIIDRLSVAILASEKGTGSIFTVQPQTVQEEMTRRGPMESDEHPSSEVRADADTLIARCAATT